MAEEPKMKYCKKQKSDKFGLWDKYCNKEENHESRHWYMDYMWWFKKGLTSKEGRLLDEST